jgi:hypothetical protein
MWDIQKLLWFDEAYLKDPNGFESELTVESFLGPIALLMIKPLAMIICSPLLIIWQELAFWTQLLMNFIYGWTEPQDIGE